MNSVLEEISPETSAAIIEQAKQLGISADEYLRGLIFAESGELALAADADDMEFEQALDSFADGEREYSNYEGSYSREDIYFDHD